MPLPTRSRSARLTIAALTAILCVTAWPTASESTSAAERAEVYVLGSLYQRHNSVPAYDLPALRRIIVAIAPDVLVVDCTPREVREEKVHASKIEYPGVVFPIARERRIRMYPAEPDEPTFTEIVQSIVEARAAFEKRRPDAGAAMKAYAASVYQALAVRWQSPADVHDGVTAAMLAGKAGYEADLIGPTMATGGARWNRHWADAIVKAAAENPGRRVLAIAGIENRAAIQSLLEGEPGLSLVDMTKWLKEYEPASAP